MTATLLLIRHATHSDYGDRLTGRADGAPLSAAGRRQAAELAERLAAQPVAAIYSSPRERTRATAAALAAVQGADVNLADALDEIDLGRWTGCRIAALAEDPAFVRWNARRGTAAPPGGEPMAEVADRVEAFARGLAADHAGQTVALVSHADVIRGFIARVLGLCLDNLLRFDIGPASVSRVELGSWGGRLLSLNEGAAA